MSVAKMMHAQQTPPAEQTPPARQTRPARKPRPARPPRTTRPLEPLTPAQRLARSALAIVAAIIFGFLANVTVLGYVQHLSAQQQLTDTLRVELAEGTAPVSEGTVDKLLLTDGTPLALLDIPAINVHEVIVEGTDSSTMRSGPGHRRDTVLPGQAGLSVVMGRAASYGGPFGRIAELRAGQEFTVTTGQGVQTFSVIGLRYAGDPAPAPLAAGHSRMILETARGLPFIPSGVTRVDADLTSTAQPAGIRQTTYATLPAADGELGTDTSTVWALAFAMQFFLVLELAAIWAFRTVGARKTWIVFIPVITLGGLLVADQVVRLLPNLL